LADGEAYYVMERLQGQPLRAWLLERLTFANRVPPGLAHLRRLIAVFRDVQERGCYGVVKPENVFLDPARGPVLTDFGVPGFLSPQEFEFNAYARRYLPYMAPELRRDWSNLLPQSDGYSLGGLLYEILVGRPPSAPLKILPSEASSLFGVEADEVVLQAMAPNPFDRFSSLEDLDAAVARLEKDLKGAAGRDTAVLPLEPGTRELAAARATDILPAAKVHSVPGFSPVRMGDEARDAEGEGRGERSPAASRTHLDSESPEESRQSSAEQPIPSAARLIEDGEESIPPLIWFLLGVLALAVCVLAAMLGGTPPAP
jgi:serine/threonine protein kinase